MLLPLLLLLLQTLRLFLPVVSLLPVGAVGGWALCGASKETEQCPSTTSGAASRQGRRRRNSRSMCLWDAVVGATVLSADAAAGNSFPKEAQIVA